MILDADKTEKWSKKKIIKIEMVSNYQLKIDNFHIISIGTVKKLAPSFFDE